MAGASRALSRHLRTSASSKSEPGTGRYVLYHTTSPVVATRQQNIMAPSFWPFLSKSCVSIWLINESGPDPSTAGRKRGGGRSASAGKVALRNKDVMHKKTSPRIGSLRNASDAFWQGQSGVNYAAIAQSRAAAIRCTSLWRRK